MVEVITRLLSKLPPLGRETNPNLACALGFLFGGVGLGIYFRSFVDFVIPIAIVITGLVAYSALGAFGVLGGAVIAALYGYYRSRTSNQALAAPPHDAAAPAAG
jgi:hypothetical protein